MPDCTATFVLVAADAVAISVAISRQLAPQRDDPPSYLTIVSYMTKRSGFQPNKLAARGTLSEPSEALYGIHLGHEPTRILPSG